MLKVATRKIEQEKLQDKIETRIVDIRDMSCFKSDCFDMALAVGDPVSYCLRPEKAVTELARMVKDGSYVIVSVDSKYPIVSRLIREESFDELSLLPRTGKLRGDVMLQAFTPEEMRALFEGCGLNVVRVIVKPVLTQSIPKENRDEVIGKEFGKLLRLELKFCVAPSLVGTAGHLEVVGVKRERQSAR
jgi:SAM-dependent methyltransferase